MGFNLPTYELPSNVLREYTGNTTWNKPTDPSFKGIWIFAAGGGGAGGAGGLFGPNPTNFPNGGGGGGGGGLVRMWIPATLLNQTESITIGSGAVSVAATNGGAGGSTLFGSHVLVRGGDGGTRGQSTTSFTLGGAGGSALTSTPIAGLKSIGGGTGGSGIRGGGASGTIGVFLFAAPGGGGGGGFLTGPVSHPGGAGGGCYNAGILTSGGTGGSALGGNATAGVSDVYLDPFLGLIASTIGIGTAGGGGGGNLSPNNGGAGGSGGRAAGGGGGGGTQSPGLRGVSGAGGNGFLIIYEVY
jgi:hypothetical protein